MKNLNHSLMAALFISGLAISSSAQDGPKMLRKYDPVKALPATVNSDNEESFPIFTSKKDTLYFVRTYVNTDKKHKKGEQDIWFSVNERGTWSEASNNMPKVNNRFNNAVVGVGKSGHTYVLNQYPSENYLTARGFSSTQKEGSEWIKPQTVVMPKIDWQGDLYGGYFTPDEKVCIVSANAFGTLGEEDLWVLVKGDDGNWSNPINLGSAINTNRAEFAPFLSADHKTLYFSSYGHKGMGDADIFAATRKDDSWSNWTTPENMGEPVNSKAFDAYINVNQDNEVYFSSRRGGKQYSDLYSTRMFFEKVAEPVKETPKVDSAQYDVDALKKKFTDLSLIHFKFNKSDIQGGDIPILDDVITLLNKRSNVNVILKGHTDGVGSESYNQKLSQRRVKAAKEWMVKKGIAENRIQTEAYGKMKPVSTNETTTGRAENRRVEIVVEITELKK